MSVRVLERLWGLASGGRSPRRPEPQRRRLAVEGLEGRQLLSGFDPRAGALQPGASTGAGAEVSPAPIAASQPLNLGLIPPGRGGPPMASIQRVSLQPRLGRVLIQFRDAFGGIDADALARGVSLTRLESPRLPLRVTSIGTPTVPPDVLEPIPGPPTEPVLGGPLLQTVAVVFEGGRPLPRGSYLLRVDSQVARTLAGMPLQGEFRGDFPTSGSPGSDFQAILTTNNIYAYLPTPRGGFFAPGNRLPQVQGGRPGSLLH